MRSGKPLRILPGLLITVVLLATACNDSRTPDFPESATKPAIVPAATTLGSEIAEPTLSLANVKNLKFERISVKQGLSHSTVNCILQDDRGFMWFGTDDGLNKYDAHSFTVYKHNPDDPHSLSHNRIWTLFEDSSGVLWVGTYGGGLNRFDRDTGQFTRFNADDFQNVTDEPEEFRNVVNAIDEYPTGVLWIATYGGGLVKFDVQREVFTSYAPDPADPEFWGHEWITAILVDNSGMVWIGTHSEGLDRFDPATGQTITYRYNPDAPDGLSHDWITDIIQDRSGQIWIGTFGGGLERLDPETDRFTHFRHDPTDPHALSDNYPWLIVEDSLGVIWIGTYSGGLDAFDPNYETFSHFHHEPIDSNSLSSDRIRAIYQAQSGLLWVGTQGGGLNKSDPASGRFTHYRGDTDDPQRPSDYQVLTLHEDELGTLWIGTAGGGLDAIDRETGEWQHYRHDPADPNTLGSDTVLAIHEDSSNTIWIGTVEGFYRFDRKAERFDRMPHNPPDPGDVKRETIHSITEDRQGFLWLGTHGRGLSEFDPVTGEFVYHQQGLAPDTEAWEENTLGSNYVKDVLEDASGRLWVGTQDGLNTYDRMTGQWHLFQQNPSNPNSLSHNWIMTLYQDWSGVLWVGTQGGGLNRLDLSEIEGTDPSTYHFTHYREQDGLANDIVLEILDHGGFLWIGTANGLSMFDPRDKTFKSYDASDGLPINEFNAALKSDRGEMFFGGINGFMSFDPDQMVDNPYVPPVVLTSLHQNGVELDTGQAPEDLREVTLHWPDNSLEFGFAALNYTQPEKNQHTYMMEGFEKDWNHIGNRRFGRYTNLPGGTYLLRLKGSNNDGVWNEEGISIQVTVVPPFWQTGWFRGIVALTLVGGALVGYRLRIRNLDARSRELEKQVEARTAELRREIAQRTRAEEAWRQREREKVVAEERNRLARDLHDSAKQEAFAASFHLGTALTLFDRDPEAAKKHLLEADNLVDSVRGELTDLIHELRPQSMNGTRFDATLNEYLIEWAHQTGIGATLTVEGFVALSLEVKQAIYRIMQEALANVARHSSADNVEVSLDFQDTIVQFTIIDDGLGFNTQQQHDGMGLDSMRERAESLKGDFGIESETGQGTKIVVTIPIK
jgi:signal transduction histidine kinase/ligand-binding sensor domain-containing protein